MNWFANLRTSTKLAIGFGMMIAIIFTMVSISVVTLNKILNKNEEFLNQDLKLLETLLQLRDDQSNTQSIITLMGLAHDNAILLEYKKESDKIINQIKILSQNILSEQANNTTFIDKFNAIKIMEEDIIHIQDTQVIPLLMQGKKEEALKIITEIIHQKYTVLGEKTLGLVNVVRDKIQRDMEDTKELITQANLSRLILGIAALIIVFGFILLLNRLIAKPLQEISRATKTISEGDLSPINLKAVGRKDEVGILAESFLLMRKSIHQLAVEISEVINSLETAVNQISAATSELVASSSETATAINQTTSTIEEVKQTSQTANDKAKLISETSRKSNELSKAGNKAAEEMMDMTNQIQHQMQQIAESMLRLSEQGQTIGSIMSTVDDMAQQSNLLSVNASIEAAKAGDQGKGFAIVAQEIKSLAGQSKQATHQVREILEDIQKATSAAVMATEQGSKSVELGVKKSEETGNSIKGLVNTVTESARDAMQIAATTHQQLVGMEQAATAMENIKTATYQNVEGSKQLEEAAKNIKNLGTKLKTLISQYKLQ